jgi:hypothetical protein
MSKMDKDMGQTKTQILCYLNEGWIMKTVLYFYALDDLHDMNICA